MQLAQANVGSVVNEIFGFFSIYSAQILYGSDAAMNIKFCMNLDIVILYIPTKSYSNSFRYQWNIWYFFLNGCADVISLKFYTKFEIVTLYQHNNYLIRGNHLFFFWLKGYFNTI